MSEKTWADGRSPWTDDEIGFLQDHPDWSAARLAAELGRSSNAIYNARGKLKAGKLGGNERVPWSTDEDSALIEAGPWITSKQLAAVLPGRTDVAVSDRRRKLGLEVLASGANLLPYSTAGRPLVAKTCTKCGFLLAGSWFRLTNGRGKREWASACRKCNAERCEKNREKNPEYRERAKANTRKANKAWTERAQQVTRQHATKNGEPYTELDHKVLADPDLTNLQKALRLGRTYSAVNTMCHNAGHTSRRDGLGDPEHDVWVIDNPNAQAAA